MYLTKIELSTANRTTWRALGDFQQLHRLVMGLFGTDRQTAHVLYRVREEQRQIALYLYSDRRILREKLLGFMTLSGERDLTGWTADMAQGQCWRFDLLASPCKKVPRQGQKNSQRRILRTMEERMQWMCRKAEQNGFRIRECRELEGSSRFGRHGAAQGGKMVLDSYHYQGILEITDEALFRSAVAQGIGPGKAYGLGMLLLSR